MTPTKELKATIANVLNLPDNSAEEKITPNRKMFSCFLSFSQDHQGFFFFFLLPIMTTMATVAVLCFLGIARKP